MSDTAKEQQKEIDRYLAEGCKYIQQELREEWFACLNELRESNPDKALYYVKDIVRFLKQINENPSQENIESIVKAYVFQPYAKDSNGQDVYHEDQYLLSISEAVLSFSKYGPEFSMILELAMLDRYNDWCEKNGKEKEESIRIPASTLKKYITRIIENRVLDNKKVSKEKTEQQNTTNKETKVSM